MRAKRKPKIVLAIDFDDTIVKSDYPKIIHKIDNAKTYINLLYAQGFGIVINTCREGLALADAINWLDANGVLYDYINCNFPHRIEFYQADCRKISADCYIDDKNLGAIIDWDSIYIEVNKKFKL